MAVKRIVFFLAVFISGIILGYNLAMYFQPLVAAKEEPTRRYDVFHVVSKIPEYRTVCYALVDSEGFWPPRIKYLIGMEGSRPVIYIKPGESKKYILKFHLVKRHNYSGLSPLAGEEVILASRGKFMEVDIVGLHLKFKPEEIVLEDDVQDVEVVMEVSLDKKFPIGVHVFYIPLIFSDNRKIQPTIFGPIYLITGYSAIKYKTLISEPTVFLLKDMFEREYLFIQEIDFSGTPFLKSDESYCITLDGEGNLTYYYCNFWSFPWCRTVFVLGKQRAEILNFEDFPRGLGPIVVRVGEEASFKIILKLNTTQSIEFGIGESGYRERDEPPEFRPFNMSFDPSRILLEPGEEVEVTVTVKARDLGIGYGYVRFWAATTVEHWTIGCSHAMAFLVVITP